MDKTKTKLYNVSTKKSSTGKKMTKRQRITTKTSWAREEGRRKSMI